MKKLLTVPFVVVMLVAILFLAACGRDSNDGYWSGEISFAPYQFGPFDPNLDIVLYRVQEILAERYDIHVTFRPEFVDFNDYHTIMATRVAAGTAPDIWVGGREDRIREYYRQGAIASWDVEFFREHAPNLAAYIDSGTSGPLGSFDGSIWWRNATVTTGTGRMNSVPAAPFGEPLVMNGVVYRGDWLEALGVETPPHNLDEWFSYVQIR